MYCFNHNKLGMIVIIKNINVGICCVNIHVVLNKSLLPSKFHPQTTSTSQCISSSLFHHTFLSISISLPFLSIFLGVSFRECFLNCSFTFPVVWFILCSFVGFPIFLVRFTFLHLLSYFMILELYLSKALCQYLQM